MANRICHVEIAVTDLAKAKSFYGDVFGWTYPMDSPQYVLFTAGDGVGGGFSPVDKAPQDGAVAIYIGVDDISQTLKRIESAGGKTVQPKTAIGGGFGYMAHVRDPFGNMMGLCSSE